MKHKTKLSVDSLKPALHFFEPELLLMYFKTVLPSYTLS